MFRKPRVWVLFLTLLASSLWIRFRLNENPPAPRETDQAATIPSPTRSSTPLISPQSPTPPAESAASPDSLDSPDRDRTRTRPERRHESSRETALPSRLFRSLQEFLWGGAGFVPPDTPDFDRKFLDRHRRFQGTYSEKDFHDGVYAYAFAQTRDGPHMYSLIGLQFKKVGRRTLWRVQWVGEGPDGLDVPYRKDLLFPPNPLAARGVRVEACAEIVVIPHFDTDDGKAFIQRFTARAYCRPDPSRPIRPAELLGQFAFAYRSPL